MSVASASVTKRANRARGGEVSRTKRGYAQTLSPTSGGLLRALERGGDHVHHVALGVTMDNPARALYERLGFTVVRPVHLEFFGTIQAIAEAKSEILAGLDAGLDNLNRRVAELGARSQRLQAVESRLNREIPDMAKLKSEETDLDLTKAITDYKMLDYAHKASLGFAGRLLSRTLLDFLR